MTNRAQFDQANERLKLLDLQRAQGQISVQAYRDERQEIIRYLNAEGSESILPETGTAAEATRKRWWGL